MNLKNQILERTAKLFRIYGIRSNTMDDIAREVGISKKTLYQHIKDKNELIELVIDFEYIKFEQQITETKEISQDPIEQLIHINILIANLLKDLNPASFNDLSKHYNLIFEESRDRYQKLVFNLIIENIRSGKTIGIYRNDLNEEIITKLHADRIQQISDSPDNWNNLQVKPDTIKEMTIYYIRGLLSNKGQDLLEKHINEFNKYLKE